MYILLVFAFAIANTRQICAQEDTANQRIILKKVSVSIIPPKHFEYDSVTDMILHKGSMASIQTKEVKNRNYKKITAGITSEYMATQGFILIDRQEIKMQDGEDAILFTSRFKSHDANGKEMDFIRLMLFSGKESTIWTTADFPECLTKQIETPIKNSITSITRNIF